MSTTFVIEGRCPTKGSVKSFPHPKTGKIVTLPMNANLKKWTADARIQARAARVPMIYKPHAVSLCVLVEFVKPKTAKQSRPTVRPDIDKLLRAVLDALTGVAYADDSQVVTVTVMKSYGATERVCVSVAALPVIENEEPVSVAEHADRSPNRAKRHKSCLRIAIGDHGSEG